jgi:transposase
MSNYRYIHPERKKAFAVMSNHFSSKAIAKSNGVSVRTIQRVTKRWRTTGQVAKRSIAIGRPRILSSIDVSVSRPMAIDLRNLLIFSQYLEGLVERTPDIYLSELQSYLEAARDIHVSEDTIQRALCNRGWTRKKVRNFPICECIAELRIQLTPVAEEADPEAQAMYEMLIGDLYQPE